MTLRIGNGAVLKSSSQWQLKEFRRLNNSDHELFIFKVLFIAIDKCHILRWYKWDLIVFCKQTSF